MGAMRIDGWEQLQEARGHVVDGTHRQDGWAQEGTEVPEATSLGEGDALNIDRKSLKRDLEGKMVSVVLDSEWLPESISKPTDGWEKVIRGLLLGHRPATLNLLITKYTMSR